MPVRQSLLNLAVTPYTKMSGAHSSMPQICVRTVQLSSMGKVTSPNPAVTDSTTLARMPASHVLNYKSLPLNSKRLFQVFALSIHLPPVE